MAGLKCFSFYLTFSSWLMSFFHSSCTWLSELQVTKKLHFLLIILTEIRFFQSLTYVKVNLKLRLLIKSGYHIVPNPPIALIIIWRTTTRQKMFKNYRHWKKPLMQSCTYTVAAFLKRKSITLFLSSIFLLNSCGYVPNKRACVLITYVLTEKYLLVHYFTCMFHCSLQKSTVRAPL